MKDDRDFLQEFREDLQDLIDQVDMADHLEDLEPNLLALISSRLYAIERELDMENF